MQLISNANENVLTILGKPRKAASGYRMIRYCTEVQTEDGILLYHLLTKELLLLSEEEYRRWKTAAGNGEDPTESEDDFC